LPQIDSLLSSPLSLEERFGGGQTHENILGSRNLNLV